MRIFNKSIDFKLLKINLIPAFLSANLQKNQKLIK